MGWVMGSWEGKLVVERVKADEGIVHRRCRHDIWLRTQRPGMSLALPKVNFSPPNNIVSCINPSNPCICITS